MSKSRGACGRVGGTTGGNGEETEGDSMSEQLYLVGEWHVTHPEAVYSGRWAKDQRGNEYRQPANLETVTVKMAQTGKEYTDWTLAGCLDWAQKQAVTA